MTPDGDTYIRSVSRVNSRRTDIMGKLAFLLLILYAGGLTLGCEIELDLISGKYPPILWKDDDFAYPEEKAEDVRVITVGEPNGNLAKRRSTS